MKKPDELVRILLVEDNPDDLIIIKRALDEANLVNKMWTVRDGQEALDFLFNRGQYSDESAHPHPGLILLDINLPKVNGIDVLREIKTNADLKLIPVIMLTCSKRDEDIINSYDYGCNSFIQKPVDFDRFVEVVKQIGLYWGLMNTAAAARNGY